MAAHAEAKLGEAALIQPALFIIEYALAKLWMSWGITPQAMMSHSVGEFVAASLAGVLSLEDAVNLVASRSALVQAQPRGAMIAVRLPEAELVPLLPETLSIAALIPRRFPLSAARNDAAEKFEAELKSKGVVSRRLETSHAFIPR